MTDLNRVYRETPALWELDSAPQGFPGSTPTTPRQASRSSASATDGSALACVANFAGVPHRGYRLGVPHTDRWDEVVNTDAGVRRLGRRQPGWSRLVDTPWHGLPASAELQLRRWARCGCGRRRADQTAPKRTPGTNPDIDARCRHGFPKSPVRGWPPTAGPPPKRAWPRTCPPTSHGGIAATQRRTAPHSSRRTPTSISRDAPLETVRRWSAGRAIITVDGRYYSQGYKVRHFSLPLPKKAWPGSRARPAPQQRLPREGERRAGCDGPRPPPLESKGCARTSRSTSTSRRRAR